VIAATVAALLVLPLVVLRGRTLRAYFATDAVTWLGAWLISLRLTLTDDQPYVACVAVVVLKLTTLGVFLAKGEHVRWSANRAALVAAILYALAIPAMLRSPIDGDEPYYLLVTESMVRDFDLDLANQYGPKRWGRDDLAPQFGDPVGAAGEQYSRHEPFLPFLMIPGYLLAGLHGALATIALFGVLLVRSTVRWMEDEGIPDTTIRALFPLFAFAPPVLFYATRIWPEVPGAFFFVEALRGVRAHRAKRWLPALFGLVMLKLRFGLVALALVIRGSWLVRGTLRRSSTDESRATIYLLAALGIIAVPLFVIGFITGDPTNVHTWRELIPTSPVQYLTGLGGLIADGMSGIAFQAPFYLFALFALTQWKKTPAGFRTGIIASLLYLFYLVPRGEWFGGWAPALRYLVFLMPVLALGIAAVWERIPREAIAVVSAWTVGLVIHGVARPWRLFHEFTGENLVGEFLSKTYGSDFSRLFPSFIRPNAAAWWWIGAIVVVTCVAALKQWFVARGPLPGQLRSDGNLRATGNASRATLVAPLLAITLALLFREGREPGPTVHFEDAHVRHEGGELYPKVYTLMRSTYRGGWVLNPGDSATFLAREGTHSLRYITGLGATFEIADQAYTVPPRDEYRTIRVTIPRSGRVTLRCLSGAINLDSMELHD
jgi:hypothetical protein